MTFETIETRSAGIANFDYFSADIHGETVSLNGTDYPLGQITLDLMNLTNDFRTELLIRCLHMFEDSQKLLGGECSEALLKSIREHIFSVLDYISDVPPFSYFDTADSRRVAEETCSDARISEYVRLNRDGPESVTDYRDTAKMWNILYGLLPCANVAKNRKVCPPEAKERKQKAADSPIAILYRKRSNSIRKDKSRGKITGRKSENAMRYLKSCYSRARAEPSYAESQYEADIQMEHIYGNAD